MRGAFMRIAYCGNFTAPHSTENELLDALLRLKVDVSTFQENELLSWESLIPELTRRNFDLVMWTSTEAYANKVGSLIQYQMLDAAKRAGIPVIGYHLDRFIGLANREETIPTRPFFSVDMLYTADGGHGHEWELLGVKHRWMPPAISERWCYLGEPDPKYDCDVVFVGGWYQYGHKDWGHREQMIEQVRHWYGDRFLTLPHRGEPRIVGGELNRVYASAKVVVGDSCLVPNKDGSPVTHYCSDRVPETLGRGGILVHPSVEGIDKLFERHIPWTLGDWKDLREVLDLTVNVPEGSWSAGDCVPGGGTRRDARIEAIEFIKSAHTYTHRMRTVLSEWGWSE